MSSQRALTVVLLAASATAQEWQQLQPNASPPPREQHSTAWDEGRQCVVLFGGFDWSPNLYYGDHWEFDGATWKQRPLTVAPSPRSRAAMCYDSRRGVTVLFGGTFQGSIFGNPVYYADTWEFDGQSWRPIPIAGPSARITSMVYDEARGVVVMMGGNGGGPMLADTWEYDGVAWTRRAPALNPPARPDYSLAYDARRRCVVAQPGWIWGHSTVMETWEWNGQTWARSAAQTLPPPFTQPAMTYDRRRGVTVLVGATAMIPAQTWEYDGVDWQHVPTATVPSNSLTGHSLTEDRRRGTLIRFGGDQVEGPFLVSSDETWEYTVLARYDKFGTGCGPTTRTPALAAAAGSAPALGAVFTAELTDLPNNSQALLLLGGSRTAWHGLPLPASLAPAGLPGCELLVAADLVTPLATAGGRAQWSVPIPSAPSLLGARFYNQGLAVDNGLQLVAVTNGAAATVGH